MTRPVDRRQALSILGSGLLLACGSESSTGDSPGGQGGASGSGAGGSSGGSGGTSSGGSGSGGTAGSTGGSAGSASGGAGGSVSGSGSIDDPLSPDDFGASCALTPTAGAGPYYFDPMQVRVDVTEGKPGAPMQLGFRVLDENCEPIDGAMVDIWQCDAQGYYAGFPFADPDQGVPPNPVPDTSETFLRGIQATDADGIATFRTIYPGFYRIRTVHIHVKVHLANNELLTTQVYFDDVFSDTIYTQTPYQGRAPRSVLNGGDGGYSKEAELELKQLSDGVRATLAIVVTR